MDNSAMSKQIFEAILLGAFLATVLYQLYWHRRIRTAMDTVLAAYRRGDYENALQAAEGLKKSGNNTRQCCLFRGVLLFQLGNLDEAESSLRQSIALTENDQTLGRHGSAREIAQRHGALAFSALGELLLEKSQYDEAMRCFETSLKAWPGNGSICRDIAGTFLRRGNHVADALDWATLAVQHDRKGPLKSADADNINLSEDLATLAWAVAAASPESDSARVEVDRLIGEAVPMILSARDGAPAVPPAALVHYQTGLAYAALGDTDQSARYLAEAARIDPTGRWGRAARSRQRCGAHTHVCRVDTS
jgi:tetratricopeptide (TPR) repeat protein